MEQLIKNAQLADAGLGGPSGALLSAPEAERMIDGLVPLTIEEVGSAKWHTQHEWIEKLNLQAHYNAQAHSDEFVVELLVSLDKMKVLVHDLLLIEAWKEHVLPLLAGHLACAVDPVLSYLLLYHEAAVANLLEVTLFHAHAAEALPEEHLLELADWAYRKLLWLNSGEAHAQAGRKELSAQQLMAQTPQQEMEAKKKETEFGVAMCSLTILRYLSDNAPQLPLGLIGRLMSTNDVPLALLPLLESPPWQRTPRPGKMEKYIGNKWTPVAPADRFKLVQADAQVWLTLCALLTEPRCRAKYRWDAWRRERLGGLKRHLNELLLDQLPPLQGLQRILDEMGLGVLPEMGSGAAAAGGGLLLESVPEVRSGITRGRDWARVAAAAMSDQGVFGAAAKRMARERLEAMVKALDFMAEMEGAGSAAAAAAANGGADPSSSSSPSDPSALRSVRLSVSRKVHASGVFEHWTDLELKLDLSKPPEPVELSAAQQQAQAAQAAGASAGNGSGLSVSASNGGGPAAAAAAAASASSPVLHGLRYRLLPLDVEASRPLPTAGKASVVAGGRVAEALVALPELPTRDSEEGAAALWVTVGLLARDGLALQLKLKKADKPKERVAGVWYAYHVVGGAVTLLREEQWQQVQAGREEGDGRGDKGKGGKAKQQSGSGVGAFAGKQDKAAAAAAAAHGASAAAPASSSAAAAAAAGASEGGKEAPAPSTSGKSQPAASSSSSQQQQQQQRDDAPAQSTLSKAAPASAPAANPPVPASVPTPQPPQQQAAEEESLYDPE